MNKKNLIFLLSVIFLAFYSCKQETIDPLDVGYDYFPVHIGHWVMYEVDSTVWDDFFPVDSPQHVRNYQYKIKEIIESEYYDNEGRLTQRLERYQKSCDTCNWFIKDVWAVNLTPSTAEKVEENNRFVKLVFPVESSASWDGNAFNILGEQDYEYEDIFEPYTVNSTSFDSTVTVIEKIDSNAIEASNQYEIYAKYVGMVFRRYRDVHIDNLTHDILSGQDYTFKIISYGN
ncbi:MAG: hypothetical protein V1904_06565 [Bacteroidota bacterium]